MLKLCRHTTLDGADSAGEWLVQDHPLGVFQDDDGMWFIDEEVASEYPNRHRQPLSTVTTPVLSMSHLDAIDYWKVVVGNWIEDNLHCEYPTRKQALGALRLVLDRGEVLPWACKEDEI